PDSINRPLFPRRYHLQEDCDSNGAGTQELLPMPHGILLIDDSKAIHALVASRLSDEPTTIMSAYSGQEGLAAARRFVPDLILLDIELPDVSGLEICRELKADKTTA